MTRVTFDLPDGDPPAEQRAPLLRYVAKTLRLVVESGSEFPAAVLTRVADQLDDPSPALNHRAPLYVDKDGDLWMFGDGGGSWTLEERKAVWAYGAMEQAEAELHYGPLRLVPWPGAMS